MSPLSGWFRRRKTLVSTVVISLVAGSTLTIAALHPGFPVNEVDLTSRDVWVTNGEQLLGGRLNKQIDELNGSVVASSPNFDVLQDGDSLFLDDPDNQRLESVDAASTTVSSSIDLPPGAEVSYGGDVLAIVSTKGELWVIPANGALQFNYVSTPPILKLGEGGHAVVTRAGAVIAVSTSKKSLYRIATLADEPVKSPFPKIGEFQLAAVGDTAVAFDQSTNQVVLEDGSTVSLGDDQGLRLQQSGPVSDFAVVATGDALIRVDLSSKNIEKVDAGFDGTTRDPDEVAAPINQDGCAHGAWSQARTYLLACAGKSAAPQEIEEPTEGGKLEFRVNRSVIALNDLTNGNVWLPSENMRLVDNWQDVTPPEEQESEEEGDEKSTTQSFEDALADRTETNRPPTAVDDEFGIRPGRTTIVSVLDNDSDPDGDVLVISEHDAVAESSGTLDLIDGGRALQYTPAEGAVGAIAFRYTVDDGRGGTASANVNLRVVPSESNQPPIELRKSGVTVEANQKIEYNVLANWRDPDGDDLFLVNASPKSADIVQFTPDGYITFTHNTSELGDKEVDFLVSDGHGQPTPGSLTVTVEPANTVKPVATPDFATTFTGQEVTIKPLVNDLSPSGAPIVLAAVEEPGKGSSMVFDTTKGTVRFSASEAGIYYFKYTIQTGAVPGIGIIRVDVSDPPEDAELPPIAVKDSAYLRGEEPVTISVLANDVSPTGKILAVQSVAVPAELQAQGLVVEVLGSTQIRVTSPAALTEQVDFTYTISDGVKRSTAGVTIVPVPPLTKHQPPIANNDAVTVRAGDIVTVDVLANDVHPDDVTMNVDRDLITVPTAGLAFVSSNTVRFQAPAKEGTYTADYRVIDAFGETAAATVTFQVTKVDKKNNGDPKPEPIVGRVLAGDSIPLDIPLANIDPDGDSTRLLRFPAAPKLGAAEITDDDTLTYTAAEGQAGTDEFTYQVVDAFGATGTATVKIAVIPLPDTLSPPNAAPDSVSIRPGRIAQVAVLDNDSDPQGAPLKVSKKLVDVPKGVDAEVVDKRYVIITAPKTEQSFSLRYEVTNNRGGSRMSYILVKVTPDAPLLPPTATDISLTEKQIASKKSVTVDPFDGYAFNPSGRNSDLKVTVAGPNASAAEVLTDGKVRVVPTDERQAIAYRVTNDDDKLTAEAFILVPAAVEEGFDDPPIIDPNLAPQYVPMNGSKSWDLKDILLVPSGRDAWIFDPSSVSNFRSNGTTSYVDKDTITFTAYPDYRGPASITFTVTDGASVDDPKGQTANLTFQFQVGDPEFRDTPPEFTPPSIQVEVGEQATFDLRSATGHPNPQILQQVTYSDLTGTNSKLSGSLSGSVLTVATPRNTPKGTTFTLGVTLKWDSFVVPGQIQVIVVGSSKPRAVAVDDRYEMQRGAGGGTIQTSPLQNDSNPFQTTNEPLKVVDAVVSNSGEPATVSHTGDRVSITPSPSLKSGTVVVIYTIQDATEDKDRNVNGTITLVVSDVPDQVQKPTVPVQGDEGQVDIGFVAPASNGKPITSYEVQSSPAVQMPTNCTPPSCHISGLQNGTSYTFIVRAINEHGPGQWSTPSNPVIPYGTPGTPGVTVTTPDPWGPGGSIRASWAAVNANGGSVSYQASLDGGAFAPANSPVNYTGLAAGNHTVTVVATNSGGKQSAPGAGTGTITQQGTPSAPDVNANVTDNQAPGTIRYTWSGGGAGNSGMTDITYQYKFDSEGWTNAGTSTSVTKSGLAQGQHTLQVRSMNKAATGNPGSASGTITQPPPNPRITDIRPTGGTCTTREGVSNACGITFVVADWTPGSYSIEPFDDLNGDSSVTGHPYTVNIPADGAVSIPIGPWVQSGSGIKLWIKVYSGMGYTSPRYTF